MPRPKPNRARLLAQQHSAAVLLDAAAGRTVAALDHLLHGRIPDGALSLVVSQFAERLVVAVEAMHALPAASVAAKDQGEC